MLLEEPGSPPIILVSPLKDLLARRPHVRSERIRFRDSDSVDVEAFVLLPEGWSKDQGRLPLLAVIHGGPQSFDEPAFQFDESYWAGLGYLVLQVNYRGSTSYGEAFTRSIQGVWGPKEHDDLMCAVNEGVKRGPADPDRLYVTGFSYGGIMTNWAVGHTDRFRAGASEHGLWDYVSAFGTDDCHLDWQDEYGMPWQNRKAYEASSPMSGAAYIRTPLLITAGEDDWRCPPSQGEQLFLTLKKRGVPTELVIDPGEHHDVGRPSRAIDRLRRITNWLSRYGGPSDPNVGVKGGERTAVDGPETRAKTRETETALTPGSDD